REGLDIPEVSLVAILDADKEGFLRSSRSLIQTIGRAARNAEGKVIMYADRVTDSMQHALSETERRRQAQEEHNAAHGITPQTVRRAISNLQNEKNTARPSLTPTKGGKGRGKKGALGAVPVGVTEVRDEDLLPSELASRLDELRAEMLQLAKELRYED